MLSYLSDLKGSFNEKGCVYFGSKHWCQRFASFKKVARKLVTIPIGNLQVKRSSNQSFHNSGAENRNLLLWHLLHATHLGKSLSVSGSIKQAHT